MNIHFSTHARRDERDYIPTLRWAHGLIFGNLSGQRDWVGFWLGSLVTY